MIRLALSPATTAALLACLLGMAHPCHSQNVRIVNVIPKRYSGESLNNPEAGVAIHPKDPRVATFTAHITGNDLCVNPNRSGFFVSKSGGDNWSLWCQLKETPESFAADLTTRFSGDGTWLHVSHLVATRLRLAGTLDMSSPSSVANLLSGAMGAIQDMDQPQIRTRPGGDAKDVAIAVINMSFTVPPVPPLPECNFARLLWAQQTTNPLGFLSACLDYRSGVRPFAIRLAMHSTGVMYAVFLPVQASPAATVGDVVIVRGTRSTPLSMRDLLETGSTGCPNDGLPGVKIVCGVDVPWEPMFNAAFGWEVRQGSLAIAVDPTDPMKVYVAWGDRVGKELLTLHVRRSSTGGATWDPNEVFTITNATNPALAVDDQGRLGFLYQQFIGTPSPRWHTRLAWTATATAPPNDIILADTPAGVNQQPTADTPVPYQGDFADLTAIGSEFYGAFSARNDPKDAKFPFGVKYNRLCSGGTLVTKLGTLVAPSVDPFFVHVQPDRLSNAITGGTGLSC